MRELWINSNDIFHENRLKGVAARMSEVGSNLVYFVMQSHWCYSRSCVPPLLS